MRVKTITNNDEMKTYERVQTMTYYGGYSLITYYKFANDTKVTTELIELEKIKGINVLSE